MTFVAAPNCIELDIIYTLSLQPIENTFHYRLPAPATTPQLQALCTVATNWFSAHVASFSSALSLEKFYARALDSASAPTYEGNPLSPLAGTNTGNISPNNVTFAVSRISGLAGRANRGRIYWPGIPTGWLETPNSIYAADAAAVVAIMIDLQTRMLAATPVATEIILHKKLGTHVDVFGYRYSDLFTDSQRRRLPAHNIHH